MAVSYYKNSERRMGMDVVRAPAKALDVGVAEFLSNRNEYLVLIDSEFGKGSRLPMNQQEYVRESVEEYMNRFYAVEIYMFGIKHYTS